MKDDHILDILDGKRFVELNAGELALINSHSAECAPCREAFTAARISFVLLKARAEAEAAKPSPFFHARVMNAIQRESQNLRKPIAALRRWWQASYALVCFMVITVAGLVALTLLAPTSNADDAQAGVTSNLYPTDAVILNQKPSRDLTDEQVFQVIYNTKYESDKRNGQ
jgi:predicted anti-sigma-YlaC factor YlaD